MNRADPQHRYKTQRDRIEALAVLAEAQARFSDRQARRVPDDRARHLADFDRMFRCVRQAAAWVVRLDQAAEDRLPAVRQRAETFERRAIEDVAQAAKPPAQPALTGLPQLPQLDAFAFDAEEPALPRTESAPRPAPVRLAAERALLRELDPARPPDLRDFLVEGAAAGPSAPRRRSG